jgi:hypothetical protein
MMNEISSILFIYPVRVEKGGKNGITSTDSG